MPADYVIITTSPFQFYYGGEAGGEQDKSFEFTLPSGAKVDSDSILSWIAEWNVHAGQPFSARININTKEVYWRYSYSGSYFGGFHAVIPANVLKEADNTNNIEFEVVGTSGSYMTFSQVYLMIQT